MKEKFKKFIQEVVLGKYILVILFILLLITSKIFNWQIGLSIKKNFLLFFVEMITFLPFMFILIGLFDVWFPKEKIEK
ncbi:MAG: hypothetical protein ACPLZ9_01425, partial [Candidatus Ratteibacteria bacterium]